MKKNHPGGFNDQNASAVCQSAFGARDRVCYDENLVKNRIRIPPLIKYNKSRMYRIRFLLHSYMYE
jgi:hypothetical protein